MFTLFLQTFSGIWVAVMIFCGLIGAFVGGVTLDYTKRYEEVAKIALAMSTLSMVWFLQVFNRENQAPNIAVCLCVFGFFAFVLMPACLELGVEITYPVAESTSTGLLWSAALVHLLWLCVNGMVCSSQELVVLLVGRLAT